MNTCKECGSHFHTPRYQTVMVCDFCLDGVPPVPESIIPRHFVQGAIIKKKKKSSFLKYIALVAVFAVIGKVGMDRYNELPPVPEVVAAAPAQDAEIFEKNKALFLTETQEKCASAVDQGAIKNISKDDCLCVSQKLFTKLEAETDLAASGSFEKGFSEGQRIFAEHSDKILEECSNTQESNISKSEKASTHI